MDHTISLMQDLSLSRSSLVLPAWFTSLLARHTNRLETKEKTHTHFTGLTLYIKLYSAVFCDSTVVICASGELLNY